MNRAATAALPGLGGGAHALLAWDVLLVGLLLLAPPSADQFAHADPVILLVAGGPGLWAAPVLCALPALVWGSPREPRAARWGWLVPAAAGAAVAAAAAAALRLAFGPRLPAFVPPEESAAPGLTLGLAASLVEEGVFHMLVLPATLGALLQWGAKRRTAGLAAVLVAALCLAAAHEIGPQPFRPSLFLTRFTLPGVVMGLLLLRAGPAFVVSLHGSAHLWIPLLLPGAGAGG